MEVELEAFEVLIAGAGPAGLSLAAELAGSVRVCLLEREAPCHTTATWYSYLDPAHDHGLDDRVILRSPNEEHAMRDECVVPDHHRVLRLWLNRAVYRGAAMVRGTYQSHCADEAVETSAGPLLLIDCIGTALADCRSLSADPAPQVNWSICPSTSRLNSR